MPVRRIVLAFLLIAAAALGLGGWYAASGNLQAAAAAESYQTPAEADDVYARFLMEAFDSIKQHYWEGLSDAQLAHLYQLSLSKAAGRDEPLATTTRAATAAMLGNAFDAATSTDARAQLALMTLQVVLYNLEPNGRDQLLSQKQETALRQQVSNINPQTDLYGTLGLADGASVSAVDAAYEKKAASLAAATSSDAKQELAEAQYAHAVLTNGTSKTLYDTQKVEPSLYSKRIGDTLYFNLTKITPTTLYEFAHAIDDASTTPGLTGLILDERGNIGGTLDFLQAFLGLFIGKNQYAFDLYADNAYDAQRTTEPQFTELSRFTHVAILTDGMTQSTAELTAAAFKRYHLATIVGTTTRGWGTVENTYPLTTSIATDTAYVLELVNHITLGDENQPIEGRGVVPDVDTSRAGWQSALGTYISSPGLIHALEVVAAEPPLTYEDAKPQ
ncbi:MAG TPA: S41 family peptidase [Candidatus Paceibacterota bacterium]|nr:S41 family peptidase [Candidatus Paceibacterota bacterium]